MEDPVRELELIPRQESLSAAGAGEGWGEGYPVPFHKS